MTLAELIGSGRAVIRIPEAAELLELKRSAAYEAAKRGEIPTLKLGRRRVVPVPGLLRMLGAEVSDCPEGDERPA